MDVREEIVASRQTAPRNAGRGTSVCGVFGRFYTEGRERGSAAVLLRLTRPRFGPGDDPSDRGAMRAGGCQRVVGCYSTPISSSRCSRVTTRFCPTWIRPEVFIPAIVVGFFGAAKSGRPSENAAKVERFVAHRSILSCDFHVAREYGLLRQRLLKKGRPLPENDIWIAATAKCHELVLVSDRRFREVDDLRMADW